MYFVCLGECDGGNFVFEELVCLSGLNVGVCMFRSWSNVGVCMFRNGSNVGVCMFRSR